MLVGHADSFRFDSPTKKKFYYPDSKANESNDIIGSMVECLTVQVCIIQSFLFEIHDVGLETAIKKRRKRNSSMNE